MNCKHMQVLVVLAVTLMAFGGAALIALKAGVPGMVVLGYGGLLLLLAGAVVGCLTFMAALLPASRTALAECVH